MVIWQMDDGKAGHSNQVIGLIQALREKTSLHYYQFKLNKKLFTNLLSIKHKGSKIPPPDFIIGAGHKTHIPLIYTRYRFGGKIILIMTPSLPRLFFDIIITPNHDNKFGKNIIHTEGALNRIIPSISKNESLGLILIGGHSKHFYWDDKNIIEKISSICIENPQISWYLTNSRRTPHTFHQLLEKKIIEIANLTFIPHQDTHEFWLLEKLNQASITYVTNDSIAMIYESITSQTKTRLIELKPKKPSQKIPLSIEKLKKEKYFEGDPIYLNEAEKVAQIIYDKWVKLK